MPAPAGYTVAITRLPLVSAAGVHKVNRRNGKITNVVGSPVLNIVDGSLSSVTVYPLVGKPVRIPGRNVTGLIVANRGDHLTFAGYTR